MASPAARKPGPLVTLVRCRTVAKVDPRVGGPQVHPVLARVIVEREQLVKVVGDLRDGLGELAPVSGLERLHRGQGVPFVLGPQISASAFFAPGCADSGSAASTLAVL
jgi:hypothetical protein